MIQQILAIWSLVPLPFLKPAWTSGSSQFTYYWSLAWRILSITLLACEMRRWVQLHACLAVSNSWQPHGRQTARLLCPWDFPGKNTGMGSHSLRQGPDPGFKPRSVALQADSLPSEPPGKLPMCLCSAWNHHPSPGWGPWLFRRTQRCIRLFCVSLEEEPVPCPRLHYCFLTIPPLVLHPLPSLICNRLNLPFGAQGRSRRQKFLFLQTKNRGHWRVFVTRRAPQSPAWFHFRLWVCKSHVGELFRCVRWCVRTLTACHAFGFVLIALQRHPFNQPSLFSPWDHL